MRLPVGVDYHVEYDVYQYHGLIRAQVDLRATSRTIELFHRGQRVALHQRRYGGRRHGTDPDHMPSSQLPLRGLDAGPLRRWAASVGPNTEALVTAILAHRPHPEQGFRTCLGVLRLFRDLEVTRAEAISARSLRIGALTYKSIASILANRLGRQPATAEPEAVIDHVNLRGPSYFH